MCTNLLFPALAEATGLRLSARTLDFGPDPQGQPLDTYVAHAPAGIPPYVVAYQAIQRLAVPVGSVLRGLLGGAQDSASAASPVADYTQRGVVRGHTNLAYLYWSANSPALKMVSLAELVQSGAGPCAMPIWNGWQCIPMNEMLLNSPTLNSTPTVSESTVLPLQ